MKSCGPFSASTAAHCEIERRVRGLLALHLVHRLDQRLRAGRVADAPAGHGVGLGDAVHGQRALVELGLHLGEGDELEVAVDQVLVHVVGQDPDVRVAQQHVRDRLHLGARVGRAGRVGGRVEDQPLGPRRDRAFERLRLELEPGLHRGLDEHRRAAAQRDHLGVGHPVRRRDHDLVARVQGGEERVVEDLLAPGADDRLRGLVVEPVLALELPHDRLAQRRDAGHGVYFVSPRSIAAFAAALMWSGVSKSGSPAASEITSRPRAFRSRAFWVIAIVAEGFTRDRTSARMAMGVPLRSPGSRKPADHRALSAGMDPGSEPGIGPKAGDRPTQVNAPSVADPQRGRGKPQPFAVSSRTRPAGSRRRGLFVPRTGIGRARDAASQGRAGASAESAVVRVRPAMIPRSNCVTGRSKNR